MHVSKTRQVSSKVELDDWTFVTMQLSVNTPNSYRFAHSWRSTITFLCQLKFTCRYNRFQFVQDYLLLFYPSIQVVYNLSQYQHVESAILYCRDLMRPKSISSWFLSLLGLLSYLSEIPGMKFLQSLTILNFWAFHHEHEQAFSCLGILNWRRLHFRREMWTGFRHRQPVRWKWRRFGFL